ncbi:MAG TPA: hypothetical protein DCM05_15235 [Elusimicrobia bacterium]|nr:hypothetical protein [Elusimicrobiota bacterium]
MSSQDDLHVGSGGFLVDRARALEKLMRFQLSDARMFLLPWIEAAVASQASRVCLSPQAGGLELCFDGRPWSAPEFKGDPYRFLFEDDPEGVRERNRQLAIGLLAAHRLKPEHVSIAFSDGFAEHVLHVKSVTEEHLESQLDVAPLAGASERFGLKARMLIWVSLPGPFSEPLDLLEKHCRRCPASIESDGRCLNPRRQPPETRLRLSFSKDGTEGEVWLSPKTLGRSRVDIVLRGVRASVEEMRLPPLQVSGWLRCDQLRKNISLTGVQKDERFEAARTILWQAAEKLLFNALREAGLLAEGVGRTLREAGQQKRWMSWEEPEGEDDSVERMSLVTAALRNTCLSRKKELWRGEPLLSLLTQAPLLFDIHGRPLTLKVLEEQRRWFGGVPYLPYAVDSIPESLAVAWAVSNEDRRFLEGLFGAEAKRFDEMKTSAVVEVAAALPDPNLLVKVSFKSASIVGEVGLSLAPHARDSHIRWLQGGRPMSITTWPLGGLRLEAVVDNPDMASAPSPGDTFEGVTQSIAALMSAAPSAYRKIASEYDPRQATPRQVMIREHLLDFAAKVWDLGRKDWTASPWLEELALFRDAKGRMLSMKDIREAAARGEKPLLRASTHPEKLQHLTVGYADKLSILFPDSELAQLEAPAGNRPKVEASAPEKKPAPQPGPAPRKTEPKKAEEQPAPAPRASSGGPEEGLKRLLKALSGMTGFPLDEQDLGRLDFVERPGKDLLIGGRGRGFSLNLAHPAARRTEAAGPLEERLPYLASMLLSALRRGRSDLTDEGEAALQLALAELLGR